MKKFILFILFVSCFTIKSSFSQGTVSDYDGNVYNIITIGSQHWLKENLKSLHYSDGTPIASDCSFNNSDSLAGIYGRLISWDGAMNNSNKESALGACPVGWHVPSDSEWLVLFNTLGDTNVAGYKLKESGTSHWANPNTGTNSSGFTALPGGNNYNCFASDLLGTHAEFWTSTEIDQYSARNWSMNNQLNNVFRHYNQDKANGFSVRCMQDISLGVKENIIEHSFKVNPNPAEDFITISYLNNHLVSFVLLNLLGENLLSGNFTNQTKVDVSALPKAMYFINLTDEVSGEKFTGKIIVK